MGVTRTRGRPDRLLVAVWLAAALDVAMLVVAAARGTDVIRDAAGSVTTGFNVAMSLVVTLAFVLAVPWSRLPLRLARSVQLYALLAQAAHASGHLAGFYYSFRPFDDVLHVGLTGGAAVLGLRAAQAWRLFPVRHSTRVRAAVLAVVAGLAVAGAWEIFEYGSDEILGSREQDDLDDTMRDMIMGLGGAVLAAGWLAWRPRADGASAARGAREAGTSKDAKD